MTHPLPLSASQRGGLYGNKCNWMPPDAKRHPLRGYTHKQVPLLGDLGGKQQLRSMSVPLYESREGAAKAEGECYIKISLGLLPFCGPIYPLSSISSMSLAALL